MEDTKLSKKGNELIKLYEEMATKGVNRIDGIRKENAYNDFQLRKFRHICKGQISNEKIKTVLDYGGGGSDWDAPDFEPKTNQSAKQFFQIEKKDTYICYLIILHLIKMFCLL